MVNKTQINTFTLFNIKDYPYSHIQPKHTSTVYGPKKIYFKSTSGDTYRGSVGAVDLLISKHVQSSPEVNTTFTLIGTGVAFRGQSGRRVMLTPQLHPSSGLRLSRAVSLLSICDFVTLCGTVSPLHIQRVLKFCG
jgi:hypothetical protein